MRQALACSASSTISKLSECGIPFRALMRTYKQRLSQRGFYDLRPHTLGPYLAGTCSQSRGATMLIEAMSINRRCTLRQRANQSATSARGLARKMLE